MRVNKIILFSISFSVSIYIIVAYCGYFTFGSDIQSNILTNYPGWIIFFYLCYDLLMLFLLLFLNFIVNTITRVSRLFVSLLVTFSYPLQIHPGRNCILTLISLILDNNNTTTLSENQKHYRWLTITVSFFY